MGNEYQGNRKKLGAKLKSEPVKTPIQEVRPVEAVSTPSVRKEAHMNFWIPEELMEKLKIHSAVSKKTIKQIGIEALEAYLLKAKNSG